MKDHYRVGLQISVNDLTETSFDVLEFNCLINQVCLYFFKGTKEIPIYYLRK